MKEEYIFFLQLSEELPESFYLLAKYLKRYELTLMPIQPCELENLHENGKEYVLSITPDLASYHQMRKVRKKFLDLSVMSKRFFLFDVSSFGSIVMTDKMERIGSYLHYPLPLPYGELARSVAYIYYKQKEDFERWPGGRRSRLPSLVVS